MLQSFEKWGLHLLMSQIPLPLYCAQSFLMPLISTISQHGRQHKHKVRASQPTDSINFMNKKQKSLFLYNNFINAI